MFRSGVVVAFSGSPQYFLFQTAIFYFWLVPDLLCVCYSTMQRVAQALGKKFTESRRRYENITSKLILRKPRRDMCVFIYHHVLTRYYLVLKKCTQNQIGKEMHAPPGCHIIPIREKKCDFCDSRIRTGIIVSRKQQEVVRQRKNS